LATKELAARKLKATKAKIFGFIKDICFLVSKE
jgi:hypothetical protein